MLAEQRVSRLESELLAQLKHELDTARAWYAAEMRTAEEELLLAKSNYDLFLEEQSKRAIAEISQLRNVIVSVLAYAHEYGEVDISRGMRTGRLPRSELEQIIARIDAVIDGEFSDDINRSISEIRFIISNYRIYDVMILNALSFHVSNSEANVDNAQRRLDGTIRRMLEAPQVLADARERHQAAREFYDNLRREAPFDDPRRFPAFMELGQASDALRRAQQTMDWVESSQANEWVLLGEDALAQAESDLNMHRTRLSDYISNMENFTPVDAEFAKLEQDLMREKIRIAEMKIESLERGAIDVVSFAIREGADLDLLSEDISIELQSARQELNAFYAQVEQERIQAEQERLQIEREIRAELLAEEARQRAEEAAALEAAREAELWAELMAELEAGDREVLPWGTGSMTDYEGAFLTRIMHGGLADVAQAVEIA